MGTVRNWVVGILPFQHQHNQSITVTVNRQIEFFSTKENNIYRIKLGINERSKFVERDIKALIHFFSKK